MQLVSSRVKRFKGVLYLLGGSGSDGKDFLRALRILPLPKKNYGNHMANLGPYMAHTWEWYGKVEWWYGADMGPYFGKIQAMGNIWKEKLMFFIVREIYGSAFPIHFP